MTATPRPPSPDALPIMLAFLAIGVALVTYGIWTLWSGRLLPPGLPLTARLRMKAELPGLFWLFSVSILVTGIGWCAAILLGLYFLVQQL